MIYYESEHYIAVPPGETIRETLEDRGLSQKDFAARMNMSEKHISHLMNGKVLLTYEMADQLEQVLGMPAYFWLGLEARYRDRLVKAQEENALDADKGRTSELPYAQMAELGWVPVTRSRTERAMNLRRYFEVVNLSLITDNQIHRIICHRLQSTDKADLALLAWAQQARIQARGTNTARINIRALQTRLAEIRALETLDPAQYRPALQQILAECGIALIYLPHLKGNAVQACTFRDASRIIIAMQQNMRSSRAFWSHLYHELGHISLGHLDLENGTTEEDEQAADAWVREHRKVG